jgi:hypothetical protein
MEARSEAFIYIYTRVDLITLSNWRNFRTLKCVVNLFDEETQTILMTSFRSVRQLSVFFLKSEPLVCTFVTRPNLACSINKEITKASFTPRAYDSSRLLPKRRANKCKPMNHANAWLLFDGASVKRDCPRQIHLIEQINTITD